MPKIRDDLVGGVMLDDGGILFAGDTVPDGVEVDDDSLVDGSAKADASTDPYKGWDKAKLEAEVDDRNDGREDDDLIVVGGNGNKADLLAALQADDTKD